MSRAGKEARGVGGAAGSGGNETGGGGAGSGQEAEWGPVAALGN